MTSENDYKWCEIAPIGLVIVSRLSMHPSQAMINSMTSENDYKWCQIAPIGLVTVSRLSMHPSQATTFTTTLNMIFSVRYTKYERIH
jgi:hypothetical protein